MIIPAGTISLATIGIVQKGQIDGTCATIRARSTQIGHSGASRSLNPEIRFGIVPIITTSRVSVENKRGPRIALRDLRLDLGTTLDSNP